MRSLLYVPSYAMMSPHKNNPRKRKRMQTFLPYESFEQSAIVLDQRRLGKQRVEVLQILQTIQGGNKSRWKNHPAVNQWRGYEKSLIEYGIIICEEWKMRGELKNGIPFKDTCLAQIAALYDSFPDSKLDHPSFLGNEEFHISHQSNLVRKDPIYYRPWFPDVPDDLEYVWPSGLAGSLRS